MTANKKQLLIESCEFVSKIKIPKKLKESVKLSSGKSGTLIVRNIPVTILNRENQNGRIYGTDVVQQSITAAQPLIEAKQLLSQACEHPEGSYVSPTTASHVVIGAYIKKGIPVTVEGKRGKFDVLFNDWEVLNTQEGKNLRALFEAECSIGTSIRGLGDLQGNQVIDYEYLGTDCVGNPSSSTYTRMPVAESVRVEIEDREPLSEGFTVSSSSTNVVNDLERAAAIQGQLENATYGTVQKTSTKLDQEIDPKTGATTSITTLEADTEDEVETLDQALAMAKNAMLNGLVDVDSVTIEKIKEEEPTNGGKKEATQEYVPEDTVEMKEEDQKEGVGGALLGGAAGALIGHPVLGAAAGSLAQDKIFGDKKDKEGGWKAGAILGGAAGSLIGQPLLGAAAGGVAQNLWKGTESVEIKEAKEKDPKEGKKFVLKAPNGYVSMEGNALTFRDDPKKALHFIVGKENTGLVHLSEVEKILDTMGVYDVQKYYKRDLGDISATPDEEPKKEGLIDGDVNMSLISAGSNNNVDTSGMEMDSVPESALNEDGQNQYEAIIKSESGEERIPVSGRDAESILAEVSNLWKQKAQNGSENVTVEFHDNTVGQIYTYNPANNSLDPVNAPQLAVESVGKDDGIEQDDNKISMTVNPEDSDPIEVEKEFDSKAQADVVKAGIEQGKIDGSILLNEEEIQPGWYVGVDGIGVIGPFETEKEARRGLENEPNISVEYLGKEDKKEAASVDKTVSVEFKPAQDIENGYDLVFWCDTPEVAEELHGVFIDSGHISKIADDKSNVELRSIPDPQVATIITTLQQSPDFRLTWKEGTELEEAGAGAAVGAGLGTLLGGPVGTVAGGALGSMAQDYFSNKKRAPGWKSGALLGGMVGGVPGALIGGGLQHMLTNREGVLGNVGSAIKNGAQKVGSAIKGGYNGIKNGLAAQNQEVPQNQQQVQAQNTNTQQAQASNANIQQQQQQQAQAQVAQQQVAQQQAAQQQVAQQQTAKKAKGKAQQAAQQAQAVTTPVLQQVQDAQTQIHNSLSQMQQLELQMQQLASDLQNTQNESVEDAQMNEVLYTGKDSASDPVVELPLKDSEDTLKPVNDGNVKVILKSVDWDIDSLANNSGNDLEGTINLLPDEIVVTIDAEKLSDVNTAKKAILDAANAQSQYKINDAIIADIQ